MSFLYLDANVSVKYYVNEPGSIWVQKIFNAAFFTQKYPLKGYDAVQLAAAHRLYSGLKKQNVEMTLISGDQQLLNAAIAEKITVDSPFNHLKT